MNTFSFSGRGLARGIVTPADKSKHKPFGTAYKSHKRLLTHVRYQDPRSNINHDHPLADAVERVVVSPVFRTAPWDAERLRQQELKQKVSLLLVSESDVCRSVLAAACLQRLLGEAGLADQVQVATCGTRPYNLGDGPEPAAEAAAAALGWALPAGHVARLFDPAADIVSSDLLLVVDKFTAGDVMREVSSFDLVNRHQQFSYKVRRLGEFRSSSYSSSGAVASGNSGSSGGGGSLWASSSASGAAAGAASYGSEGDDMDIDDPLYGNVGGEAEEQAVLRACRSIQDACRGLVAFLLRVQAEAQDASCSSTAAAAAGPAEADKSPAAGSYGPGPGRQALGPALRARVHLLGPTPWVAPPMLSPRVNMDEMHGR